MELQNLSQRRLTFVGGDRLIGVLGGYAEFREWPRCHEATSPWSTGFQRSPRDVSGRPKESGKSTHFGRVVESDSEAS